MTQISGFHLIQIKNSSRELKILNYHRLWKDKKFLDENQRVDWIKSIYGFRLVNIGRLADINFLTR